MGAEQSSTHDSPAPPPAASKVCYYELLGVERTASEDEIRKAYRRKALELHPDRNYNDVDNATRKFAEIQSAYEVLSDAQERAWYDSHRDIILRGEDPAEDRPAAHNANVTAAQDLLSLLGRFNSSTPFTDEPQGFFGTIRKTFAQLADEENAAAYEQGFDPLDYPDFGMADDDFNSVVKPFYSFWLGFGTQKSFAWKDRFRYSDAPDRKIRRLMEKENKRYRDEGIREFNEAVRTVVSFVRSRDPRYLRNAKSDAERQQDLRKASAAQAARSRAANRAKDAEYVPSAWTQTEGPEEQVGSFSESEESVVEHIECVICDKIFKSEKQYEMHEKSKKHIKAVQQLKRQMQKENKSLNLEVESVPPSPPPPVEDNEAVVEDTVPESEPVDVQEDIASTESELDDDYAPREEVQTRILGKTDTHEDLSVAVENISLTDTLTDTPTTGEPRVGKAKAKRAKKAARLEQEIQTGQQHKCATCNEAFSSKSKLFDHIRDLDHAQMVPRGMAKSNKARKKR